MKNDAYLDYVNGQLTATQAVLRALLLSSYNPRQAVAQAAMLMERTKVASLNSSFTDEFLRGVDAAKTAILPSPEEMPPGF